MLISYWFLAVRTHCIWFSAKKKSCFLSFSLDNCRSSDRSPAPTILEMYSTHCQSGMQVMCGQALQNVQCWCRVFACRVKLVENPQICRWFNREPVLSARGSWELSVAVCVFFCCLCVRSFIFHVGRELNLWKGKSGGCRTIWQNYRRSSRLVRVIERGR